jgi:hypothetical protein
VRRKRLQFFAFANFFGAFPACRLIARSRLDAISHVKFPRDDHFQTQKMPILTTLFRSSSREEESVELPIEEPNLPPPLAEDVALAEEWSMKHAESHRQSEYERAQVKKLMIELMQRLRRLWTHEQLLRSLGYEDIDLGILVLKTRLDGGRVTIAEIFRDLFHRDSYLSETGHCPFIPTRRYHRIMADIEKTERLLYGR